MGSCGAMHDSRIEAHWAPGKNGLLLHAGGYHFHDALPPGKIGFLFQLENDPEQMYVLADVKLVQEENIAPTIRSDRRYAFILSGRYNTINYGEKGMIIARNGVLVECFPESGTICPCGRGERCTTVRYVSRAVIQQVTGSGVRRIKAEEVHCQGWIIR